MADPVLPRPRPLASDAVPTVQAAMIAQNFQLIRLRRQHWNQSRLRHLEFQISNFWEILLVFQRGVNSGFFIPWLPDGFLLSSVVCIFSVPSARLFLLLGVSILFLAATWFCIKLCHVFQ